MNLVILFYFLSSRTLHTNCPYVTSFIRLCGILFLVINEIVLIGFLMVPPTPFASRPNLFADDVLQCFLSFGFLISCLYLINLPVSVSMTAKDWWTSFSSCVMATSTID